MTWTDQDVVPMRRALDLARLGQGWVEPNPMVGCVLWKDGAVVGEGYHQKFGGPHAEPNAIAAAGDAARSATAYVTLEPCAHEGKKTPPCAPLLFRSGIRKVFAAVLDPNPLTTGKCVEQLRAHGIEVDVGLCREEAVRLNAAFFKRMKLGLPLVTAKWAMTLDGRIAAPDRSSKWISCEESRRVVHEMRGVMDAVIVGIGTALADDPELTCRLVPPRRVAARIVLDPRARLPLESRLARSAQDTPTLVAVGPDADQAALDRLREAGCEVLPFPVAENGLDLRALLAELGRRGMSNVLVEGGSRVLGSFYDNGLIDRVTAFVAPKLLGHAAAISPLTGSRGRTMAETLPLRNVEVRQVGEDILIEGWLNEPLEWAE